jgi:hypothetical protein
MQYISTRAHAAIGKLTQHIMEPMTISVLKITTPPNSKALESWDLI